MAAQERCSAWKHVSVEFLVAVVLVGPVLSFQLQLNQIQVRPPATSTLPASTFRSVDKNHEQPGSLEELSASSMATNCTCNSPNMTSARSVLPLCKMDGAGDVASVSEGLNGSKQQFVSEDVLPKTKSRSLQQNRRIFMASVLIGTLAAGGVGVQTLISGDDPHGVGSQSYNMRPYMSKLAWEVTPVNKRTGVTVFDAEKAGYNIRFVTYLSRFLLCFDVDCQRWWYNRSADIPRRATAQDVERIRLQQFAAFSASVEVGLQEYRGTDGPSRLMDALLTRYCRSIDDIKRLRAERGLASLNERDEEVERREILESRRQIALLFGLMESNQPVEEITTLLAAIDNGSIVSVALESSGFGYAPGYGPPQVTFPPPRAGKEYETATGRAMLRPNGLILRFDLLNRGYGYSKPPSLMVSEPGADRGVIIPGARTAQGKVYLFKKGVNRGRVQQIVVTDPGKGYIEGEKIRAIISPPELEPESGGVTATAAAVLEYEVSGIEIVNGGTGYAVEKPIPVVVDPPPLTARVNMNDPFMTGVVAPDKPLPATTRPGVEARKRINLKEPNSVSSAVERLADNDGKGGGGGCIGRACYDNPVVAYATAEAEKSSFSTFRKEGDGLRPFKVEEAISKRRYVSATTSGADGGGVPTPFFGGYGSGSSSLQLLTLLPEGIGLEYDTSLKRFVLAAGPDFAERNEPWLKGLSSNRALEPDFGPRGRSPIERDVQLTVSSFLRFCLSGAICCSCVHLVLTPIDVVKTKVQTKPERYPDAVSALKKLLEEAGLSGFFAGWVPTFVGFFIWGGFSYSLTEYLRRYFVEIAGSDAMRLEVPIILSASAIGAFLGAFVLCPFEAVRIRSVAQPDYGSNAFAVATRMVKDEGFLSLFNIVPPFLLKEIPFAMAKFTVFDLSTRWLYEAFPVAREDVQLSLLVSLAGGTLGGLCAAVASNPGDATVSEMKKAKTDMGTISAIRVLLNRGGGSELFRGLPLRMTFYPLVVSLQFLVYDAVRLSLGIGADDLKVYLDVLGGALKDGGSMVGPV